MTASTPDPRRPDGHPNLTLDVDLDVANANVHVEYDIVFDAYDIASDQPYIEVLQLIGDDTNVPGDPASAAPDDLLLTLIPQLVTVPAPFPFPLPFPPSIVQSNGQPSMHRVIDRTIAALNEDKADAPNPDEIRAVVSLTPKAPGAVKVESNRVALNL